MILSFNQLLKKHLDYQTGRRLYSEYPCDPPIFLEPSIIKYKYKWFKYLKCVWLISKILSRNNGKYSLEYSKDI